MFNSFLTAQRRICREYRHSWVVVVGSTDHYPTLQSFVEQRCLTMRIQETNGGSSSTSARSEYIIEVTDVVEDTIKTSIMLPTGVYKDSR